MINNPKVSVLICTYNHENYIEESITSALRQCFSQSYEILIGDDFSSDFTRRIVEQYQKAYPNQIRSFFNPNNLGASANFLGLVKASRGEYVAVLDGDDFWIDPYKLQKQWEIVQKDPSYGMVCSYASVLDQESHRLIGTLGNKSVECFKDLIVSDVDVASPTLFFNKRVLEKCISESDWYISNNYFFDSVISYWFAYFSRIYFIPEELAVYRVLRNSGCHADDLSTQNSYRLRYYSIKLRFLLENKVPIDMSHPVLLQEWIKAEQYGAYQSDLNVRKSKAYRMGAILLKPFRIIKNIFVSLSHEQ